ncbi:hypothetical protein ACFFP0_24930 [Rhizobium puerariae]|uniref:Uncharacterized protein n=1 Tax=Rhizobium puerariae TaxID=1585791 RepID=A0ABV6AS12_9HYPH
MSMLLCAPIGARRAFVKHEMEGDVIDVDQFFGPIRERCRLAGHPRRVDSTGLGRRADARRLYGMSINEIPKDGLLSGLFQIFDLR